MPHAGSKKTFISMGYPIHAIFGADIGIV